MTLQDHLIVHQIHFVHFKAMDDDFSIIVHRCLHGLHFLILYWVETHCYFGPKFIHHYSNTFSILSLDFGSGYINYYLKILVITFGAQYQEVMVEYSSFASNQ